MRGLLGAALLLAAGCASAPPAAPAGPAAGGPIPAAAEPDPVEAMADDPLRIECDRVRVVVPERLRADVTAPDAAAGPPYEFRVRAVRFRVREAPPEIDVAGEDFSVVAEGIVRMARGAGRVTAEEGPFEVLVLRNGRMMRR